jgi:hypothetical protein
MLLRIGGGIGKILKHRRNGAEQTNEAGFERHVQVASSIQSQKKYSRCCGILWYQMLNDEYSLRRRGRESTIEWQRLLTQIQNLNSHADPHNGLTTGVTRAGG